MIADEKARAVAAKLYEAWAQEQGIAPRFEVLGEGTAASWLAVAHAAMQREAGVLGVVEREVLPVERARAMAEEREACARICEAQADNDLGCGCATAGSLARRIRARGAS